MTTDALASFAAAEAALDAGKVDDAAQVLADVYARDSGSEFETLLAEAAERLEGADIRAAAELLERARTLAVQPHFTAQDRARVAFELGCCRLKLGMVPEAVQLFSAALELAARCGDDRLQGTILCWRTRCYRRQREWEAARNDAEAALRIADRLADASLLGEVHLQASQVAERTGQLLIARFYAERAAEYAEEAGDLEAFGKAMNNVGGLAFLLGRADEAKAYLKKAFRIALEAGNDLDAAYAVSSSAQVMLRTGDAAGAESGARYALQLLAGRNDHANEVGNAQLVLGRALMQQGRFDEADEVLRAADESFAQMDSVGHRAAAWLAQGDLSAEKGDVGGAAAFYRRAADVLQDVRF